MCQDGCIIMLGINLYTITMNFSENYSKLYDEIFKLYHLPENQSKLLFHGWHHIKFVLDKAVEFAGYLNANVEQVAAAALVHDLNYIFSDKLEPEAAKNQVIEYVTNAGYPKEFAEKIEIMLENAHLAYRGERELSLEDKALADADTLFKALPTTPILFASRFITQNKYDIEKLGNKVVGEQEPLMQQGIYFYTEVAKERYLGWATANLALWKNVLEALKDPSVKEMLATASELGVL